jgi:hypothetical protein
MEDVMKHKAYFTNLVIDRPLSHFKGGGMAAASSLLKHGRARYHNAM